AGGDRQARARAAGRGGGGVPPRGVAPRQHFLDTLGRYWPELLPRYLADYRTGPYLSAEKTRPVQSAVSELVSRVGLGSVHREFLTPPPAPPEPQQLSLLAS